eukprot:gene9405-1613_t
MAIDMKALKKQMMKEMKDQEKNQEKEFGKKILTKHCRVIFNTINFFNLKKFIIDTREKEHFEKSSIVNSVNIPPSKNLEMIIPVVVKRDVDYIIIYSNKNETKQFAEKKGTENHLGKVLSLVSKLETKVKGILLIHNGFEEFQENYSFLCHAIDDSNSTSFLTYPNEILSNFLYLGDFSNGNSLEQIQNLKIENVLNLSTKKVDLPKYINQLHLITDYNELPIEESIKFIENSKGRILVFCDDGVSKSAAIVCAYLMLDLKLKESKYSPIIVVTSVERCRPMVKIEKQHYAQLFDYEKELSGEKKDMKQLMEEESIELISID